MQEPAPVGTEWQLAPYRDRGAESPVPVRVDSTLSLSAAGRFVARACNRMGVPPSWTPTRSRSAA